MLEGYYSSRTCSAEYGVDAGGGGRQREREEGDRGDAGRVGAREQRGEGEVGLRLGREALRRNPAPAECEDGGDGDGGYESAHLRAAGLSKSGVLALLSFTFLLRE